MKLFALLQLTLFLYSISICQPRGGMADDTAQHKKTHVDTSAVGWYSSRQYPEALRKVYRYKPLIGGDTSYWGGAIPHEEVMMGFLVLDSGATYPGHLHPSPEIYYVIEGEARWTVGNETFVAKPGTAIYTPPNTLHRMINTGGQQLRTAYYWWAPEGDREILNTSSQLVEEVPTSNKSLPTDSVRLRKYTPSQEPKEHHYVYLDEVDWTTNWSYPEVVQRVYRYKPLIGGNRADWPGIVQEDVGMGLQELDPG